MQGFQKVVGHQEIINDIRMILALCLFTGRAFHTGLDPVLLALKRHRKQ